MEKEQQEAQALASQREQQRRAVLIKHGVLKGQTQHAVQGDTP